MAVGMGYDSWCSVVEETTYGTTPGTGETYLRFVNESIVKDIGVKPRKSLAAMDSYRDFMESVHKIGGDLTLELNYEGMGLFIKHALGTQGYGFTADSPVAGANTHVFKIHEALTHTSNEGLSIEIAKANIPSGKVFLYEGCSVNTLRWTFTDGEIVEMVAGLLCSTETANTSASGTPAYPTDVPVYWRYAGALNFLGEASTPLRSGYIQIDNKLSADRYLLNEALPAPLRTDHRVISGEFVIEFEDLTEYNKYLGLTTGAIDITFSSVADLVYITGTTPYTIKFDIPKAILTAAPTTIGGPGPIEVTYAFQGMYKDADEDELIITVVNGEATLA